MPAIIPLVRDKRGAGGCRLRKFAAELGVDRETIRKAAKVIRRRRPVITMTFSYASASSAGLLPVLRRRIHPLRCIKLLTVHPGGSACLMGEVLVDPRLGQRRRPA